MKAETITKIFPTYNSWLEFLAPEQSESRSRMTGYSRDRWAGGSWDFAIDAATSGWGGWSVDNLEIPSFPAVPKRQKRRVRSPYGPEVDPVRYGLGDPECCFTYRVKRRRVVNVVKINFNLSASCKISSDAMLRRGRAVVSLVEALFMRGINVEVVVSSVLTDRPARAGLFNTAYIEVPVRSASDPVDRDRMYYMLGHPSAFRRLMFSTLENMDSVWDRFRDVFGINNGGNYGYPGDVLSLHTDANILLNANTEFDSDETARTWVREVYDEVCC